MPGHLVPQISRKTTLPVIGLCVLLLTSFLCSQVRGVDDRRLFQELDHTGWTIRDGAPPNIADIAQTADGYLWIATEGGLYLFDGVQFERFQPAAGPPLLSDSVSALLPMPDGGLWIGYSDGGASLLTKGKLRNYSREAGLGSNFVSMFASDQDGTIWAATSSGLERLENSHWTRIDNNWNYPAAKADSIYVDRRGTLWVTTGNTIVFLRKNEKQFHLTGLSFTDSVVMTGSKDGTLWTSGIAGRVIPFQLSAANSVTKGSAIDFRSLSLLIDHEGMLWVATTSKGI